VKAATKGAEFAGGAITVLPDREVPRAMGTVLPVPIGIRWTMTGIWVGDTLLLRGWT
jgi:hypothetical protein